MKTALLSIAVVLLLVSLLTSGAGCATATDAALRDATLWDLEDGFTSLRHGDLDSAHASMAGAVASFDDLAQGTTSLEQALQSDPDKPYRGRAHERVLAAVTLAALDIKDGRCDLALPTLHQAAYLDAVEARERGSDAALIYALQLRCLRTLGAAPVDVARAKDGLRHALGTANATHLQPVIEALAHDPRAVLIFDGDGPLPERQGGRGERIVWSPRSDVAPVLGEVHGAAGGVVVPLDATLDAATVEGLRGIALWSSWQQATTVDGRPFDQVLAERAALKDQSEREGRRLTDTSLASLRTALATAPKDDNARNGALVNAGVHGVAGVAAWAVSGALDARADDRAVDALFERVVLARPGPLPLASDGALGSALSHAALDPCAPALLHRRAPADRLRLHCLLQLDPAEAARAAAGPAGRHAP